MAQPSPLHLSLALPPALFNLYPLLCFRTQVLSSHPLPRGVVVRRARVVVNFVYIGPCRMSSWRVYIYRVYNIGLCGWLMASRCKGVGRNSLGRTCLPVIIAKGFMIIIFRLFLKVCLSSISIERHQSVIQVKSDLIFKKLSS